MKKSFTTFLLCTISILVVAQPQLKSSNYQIGDAFDLYQISGITITNLASKGANATWSTAAGTPTLLGTASFINPSTTTYGSTYPDANFGMKFSIASGTMYNFMKNSANGMEEIVTNLGAPTPYVLTTYRLFLPFTMNYTDSVSKSFQKSGQSASSVMLKYDAFGTLTTADSSYTNCARMYRVDLQGNGFVSWYVSSSRYPVLIWDGSQFLYFKKKSVTTGISETAKNSSFEMFPNPATNELNIACNETFSKVDIYSISGKLELSTSQNKMDVSELSQGIYLVKVYSQNGIATQKFIKK